MIYLIIAYIQNNTNHSFILMIYQNIQHMELNQQNNPLAVNQIAVGLVQDNKKQSMKQFIAQRKKKLKESKKREGMYGNLKIMIQNKEYQKFSETLFSNPVASVLALLFEEDQTKTIFLVSILQNNYWRQFFPILNGWSAKNAETLFNLFSKESNNAILDREWQYKFLVFNKALLKHIVPTSQNYVNPAQFVTLFSQKDSLFGYFYKRMQYADIKKTLTHQDEMVCLTTFFWQLFNLIDPTSQTAKKINQFRLEREQNAIWGNNQKYTLAQVSKENYLELKQLQYTIFHNYAKKQNKENIFSMLKEVYEFEKDLSISAKLQFTRANNANETVVDIILRTWDIVSINDFLQLTQCYPNVVLTSSCLNKVLKNQMLNQQNKQALIIRCLEGQYANKGYIELVRTKKKFKKYCLRGTHSDGVYHFDQLIVKSRLDCNDQYPLTLYLSLYSQKCSLKIIQKLMIPQLQRKTVKKITALLINTLNVGLSKRCTMSDEQMKAIDSIIDYVQPLLKCLYRLPHGEVFFYLIKKTYINKCELTQIRSKEKVRFYTTGYPFILSFIENTPFLGKDEINQFVLDTFLKSRATEKGENNSHLWHQMLPYIAHCEILHKSTEFLPSALKNAFKQYFDSLKTEQYIQEISYNRGDQCLMAEFLFPYNAKQGRYFLFNKQQMAEKFNKINLRGYLQVKKTKLAEIEYKKQKTAHKILLLIDDKQQLLQFGANKYYTQMYKKQQTLQNWKILIMKNYHGTNKIYKLSILNLQLAEQIFFLLSNQMSFTLRKDQGLTKDTLLNYKGLKHIVQKMLQKKQTQFTQALYWCSTKQQIDLSLAFIKEYFTSVYCQSKEQQLLFFHHYRPQFVNFNYQKFPFTFICVQKITDIQLNLIPKEKEITKISKHQKDMYDRHFLYYKNSFQIYSNNISSIKKSINIKKMNPQQDIIKEKKIKALLNQIEQYTNNIHKKIFKQILYGKENYQKALKQVFHLGQYQVVSIENIDQQGHYNNEEQIQKMQIKQLQVKNQNNQLPSMQIHEKIQNIQQQEQKIEWYEQEALLFQNRYFQKHYKTLITLIHKVGVLKFKQFILHLDRAQVLIMKFLSSHDFYQMSESLLVVWLQQSPQPVQDFQYFFRTHYEYCSSDAIYKKKYTKGFFFGFDNNNSENQNNQHFIDFFQQTSFDIFKQCCLVLVKIQSRFFDFFFIILAKIKSQQKKIFIVDLLHTIDPQYAYDYKFYMQPTLIQLSVSILLNSYKKQNIFSFSLIQNDKLTIYNEYDFYARCSNDTFKKVIKNLDKHLSMRFIVIIPQAQASFDCDLEIYNSKLEHIARSIILSMGWSRMTQIINVTTLYPQFPFIDYKSFITKCFQMTGHFDTTLHHQSSNESYVKYKQTLFAAYEQHKVQFKQQLFVIAYGIDSKLAMRYMQPTTLRAQSFYKCLKKHPTTANLLKNVQVNPVQYITFSKAKYLVPIVPYKHDLFQKYSWMEDLFVLQMKLLLISTCPEAESAENVLEDKNAKSSVKNTDLLKKCRQALFYLNNKSVMELYTKSQIQKLISKILYKQDIKSLKEFQKYIPNFKNQIKQLCQRKQYNLQIMQQQNVFFLISQMNLDYSHFFNILKTQNMKIISKYLKKHNKQINVQFISQCQTVSNNVFWDVISDMKNQNFVIQLLNKYNLLHCFTLRHFSKALLQGICRQRSNKVLKYLLQQVQKLVKTNLKYIAVQDNEAQITQNGIVKLPIILTTATGYYEYLFLIKGCCNAIPTFSFKFQYCVVQDTSIYTFIPQLKRRINIFKAASIALSRNNKKNFILDEIFSVIFGNTYVQKDLKTELNDLKHFLEDIVQTTYMKRDKITKYYIVYSLLINKKHQIPQKQILETYHAQGQFVLSLKDFFIYEQATLVNLKQIINQNQKLILLLLIYNFPLFMSYFGQSFFSQQKHNDAAKDANWILLFKGIAVHLVQFQTLHLPILQWFIADCEEKKPIQLGQNHQQFIQISSPEASSFLKRNTIILIIISNHTISPLFSSIGSQNIEQSMRFLFNLTCDLNCRGQKPSFDSRLWSKIQQQLAQIMHLRIINQIKNISIKPTADEVDLKKQLYLEMFHQRCAINKIHITNIKQVVKESMCALYTINYFELVLLENLQLLLSTTFQIINDLLSANNGATFSSLKVTLAKEKSNSIAIQQNLLSITLQYEMENQKIVFVDLVQKKKNIEYYILKQVYRMKPEIELLTKYCTGNEIHKMFKDRKFLIDLNSFEKHQENKPLSLIEENIFPILTIIQGFNNKAFMSEERAHYNLNDLFGPIKINQDTSSEHLLHCCMFYQILILPSEPIYLKYLQTPLSQSEIKKKQLKDIAQYHRYFLDEGLSQTQGKIYKFDNTIYLCSEEKGVKIYTYDYSLCVVLDLYSRLKQMLEQTMVKTQSMAFQLSIPSFLEYYHRLNEISECSLKDAIKSLMSSQSYTSLINDMIFAITQDVANLIKLVKCVNIRYAFVAKFNDKIFILGQHLGLVGVKYQVKQMILIATFQLYLSLDLSQNMRVKQMQKPLQQFVNRGHFLQSVFTSVQFLTDYFIDKTALNQECVKLSREFTDKLNSTTNIYVAYDTLYRHIREKKKTESIANLDKYLHKLKLYLNNNLEKFTNKIISSSEIAQAHEILVLNKFQSMFRRINFKEIERANSISYKCSSISQQCGLKQIDNYCGKLISANPIKEQLKNMFLIQIYISYFKEIIAQARNIILGHKSNNKPPFFLKAVRTQQSQSINLNEIQYLLIVSDTLPSQQLIDPSKIIRIFVSDLNQNLFELHQTIRHTLLNTNSDNRKISDLVPIIQPNIRLQFFGDVCQSGIDTETTTVFETRINSRDEFKLDVLPRSCPTVLSSLKRDKNYRNSINKLLHALESMFSTNIQVVIEPPHHTPREDLAAVIKFLCEDIEQFLDKMFKSPSRNTEVQFHYAIEEKLQIRENIYIQLRKAIFLSLYKKIRISSVDKANASRTYINGQEIVFEFGNNPKEQLQSSQQMLTVVLQDIILKKKPKQLILHDVKNSGIQLMLKVIDCISTFEVQKKQINDAIELVKASGFTQCPVLGSIAMSTQPTAVFYQKETISLIFSIHSPNRQYFSLEVLCSSMLSKMPKLHLQNYKGINQLYTKYLPSTKQITIYNYHSQDVKLFMKQDGKWVHRNIKFALNAQSILKSQQLPLTDHHKYAVVVGTQVSANYIYAIKAEDNIIKQASEVGNIQQSKYLYLTTKIFVDTNQCPLTFAIKDYVTNAKKLQGDIWQEETKQHFKIHMLSKETIKMTVWSKYSIEINIYFGEWINFFNLESKLCKLRLCSTKDVTLEKTEFIRISSKGKQIQIKKTDRNINNYSEFEEPLESLKVIEPFEPKEVELKSINIQSLVYTISDQSKMYLTKVGQSRIDWIQFCDNDRNPINASELKIVCQALFVHNNNLTVVKPQLIVNNTLLGLQWTPKVRGSYSLMINNFKMHHMHEIGAYACQVDIANTKVTSPLKTSLYHLQETEVSLELRDRFGNIYSNLQETMMDQIIIGFTAKKISQSEQPIDQIKVVRKDAPADKYGTKNIKIHISLNCPTKMLVQVQVTVMLNFQVVSVFVLKIQGSSLADRRKNLTEQIQKITKKHHRQIVIRRAHLMQDLFTVAKMSLHYTLAVKFANEPGIDAGGLKRQFYDMIGNEMKATTNPFFMATGNHNQQYFLSPDILNQRKRLQYMELWGKYLANSILNSYLIGVAFSPVFVKLLYKQEVGFQDMLLVLPPEQAKTYNYLLTLPQDRFEELCLYFVVLVDKKKGIEKELKPLGKNIPVTKTNLKEYLELLAQQFLVLRYKEIVDSFRTGFESVIPLAPIMKLILPQQFWCLSAGTGEITPELVLAYINYTGHKIQTIVGWFNRYITESNAEVLKGFLKFSSGSSSIDFGMVSKINVSFENAGDNPKKLPISHTCWKQIVVPKYKTYDIMKKLLDAAFIYCSQGFGFG